MLTDKQKEEYNNLFEHRDRIVDSLFHIEKIIKEYFPEEFEVAYQHWIPQIITALCDDKRWLPRGQFNMQQTLVRLADKLKESDSKGVSKYI